MGRMKIAGCAVSALSPATGSTSPRAYSASLCLSAHHIKAISCFRIPSFNCIPCPTLHLDILSHQLAQNGLHCYYMPIPKIHSSRRAVPRPHLQGPCQNFPQPINHWNSISTLSTFPKRRVFLRVPGVRYQNYLIEQHPNSHGIGRNILGQSIFELGNEQ